MSKKLIAGLLLVGVSVLACKKDEEASMAVSSTQPAKQEKGARLDPGLLIAHALGDVNGVENSNSIEALECNYRRGFRWFEVDLALTSDAELVCFHKGNEKLAGLPDSVRRLPLAQVEGKKYAGRYPIARFSTLLKEADRVGNDIVLVTDTAGWTDEMEGAVAHALGTRTPGQTTRVVLQSYGEQDADRVAKLSKEVGVGVFLNLQRTAVGDAKVEELARKYAFLAVVANTGRFTPWLAERLHAANVPVVVPTVNEHREIVSLTRAGADGFFTDRYVPYAAMVSDAKAVMNCGEAKPTPGQLDRWTLRDLAQARDFQLRPCAKRQGGRVELNGCDERPALKGALLAVPAAQALHVEVDVEAGDGGASFWIDLVEKDHSKPIKPRKLESLKPKERRTFRYEVDLPRGSVGVETRFGLGSKADRLTVHRLRAFHGELPAPDAPAPTVAGDAGNGTQD